MKFEIGCNLQETIEFCAISAAALIGIAITKNPNCLWALFFAVMV